MSLYNAKLPSLKDKHRAMLAAETKKAPIEESTALPAKKAKVGKKLKVKK